jgi:hypothetical protein
MKAPMKPEMQIENQYKRCAAFKLDSAMALDTGFFS